MPLSVLAREGQHLTFGYPQYPRRGLYRAGVQSVTQITLSRLGRFSERELRWAGEGVARQRELDLSV
jgi:hypothetical protein